MDSLESRHEASQVVGVRADIAERTGRAALAGVGAPGGLLLLFVFQLPATNLVCSRQVRR